MLERQAGGAGELCGDRRVVEQTRTVNERGELAAAGHDARHPAIRFMRDVGRPAVAVDPAGLVVAGMQQLKGRIAERVRQLVAQSTRWRRSTEVHDQRRELIAHAPRPHALPRDAGRDEHERRELRRTTAHDPSGRWRGSRAGHRAGARTPNSAIAVAAGRTTGISTRRRAAVARAKRTSTSAANAADQAAATTRPARPGRGRRPVAR